MIVNYYGEKDYMGGHLDDGEPDQSHPIVSISLGLSAIFMIGGRTKDQLPKTMILESGDACVMSKFSRLCYHGVPKVLPNTFQFEDEEFMIKAQTERNLSNENTNTEFNAIKFLQENRININFRQVVDPKTSQPEKNTAY